MANSKFSPRNDNLDGVDVCPHLLELREPAPGNVEILTSSKGVRHLQHRYDISKRMKSLLLQRRAQTNFPFDISQAIAGWQIGVKKRPVPVTLSQGEIHAPRRLSLVGVHKRVRVERSCSCTLISSSTVWYRAPGYSWCGQ